jgi:hypothetical protein
MQDPTVPIIGRYGTYMQDPIVPIAPIRVLSRYTLCSVSTGGMYDARIPYSPCKGSYHMHVIGGWIPTQCVGIHGSGGRGREGES